MNNYFIGIGVAKAGTSWLADYFKTHPEICFSPLKEIHYFDHFFLKPNDEKKLNRINFFKDTVVKLTQKSDQTVSFDLKQYHYLIEMYNNPQAYHNYFSLLKKDNEKICGEITPAYSMLSLSGLLYIKKFLKNPKIVIILRNPVDRQWSQVRFHKKFFPNLVFEDYYVDSFNMDKFTKRSSYQDIIPGVFSVFEKDEVHVIFYEYLFNKNFVDNEIRNLCKFLGVSYVKPMLKETINPSAKATLTSDLRAYGINQLQKSYGYVYQNFEKVPKNWLKDINSIYCT